MLLVVQKQLRASAAAEHTREYPLAKAQARELPNNGGAVDTPRAASVGNRGGLELGELARANTARGSSY